jgi:hypothetical protein
MVLLSDDGERETSLAAEPHLSVASVMCFHRSCFAGEILGLG